MMQYKDVVREMFARHKGKPAKDVMRMAAAQWQAIKAGKKPAKARKARGGAIDPMSIASGVSSALPIVGDLVSGISDLFSSKPDPDKQLQRDYALREYNRLNGTRYGVEGTHWNVPYGAGLKKRGKRGGAMSAGAMSAGSLGNIASVGKLASGLRGMGGSGRATTLGSMNRGGAVSAGNLNGYRTVGGYVSGGGASGGAVSAGSLGDILSSALPFMSLL